MPLEQFPDGPPKPGTEIECEIEGYDGSGNLILTRKGSAVSVDWSTVAEGQLVEARVTETNKGGLAVEVNGIRGFMPVSQIDLYRVEDTQQFVNQKLLCLVTEVKPDEKNLVVSRRALLEKEREEKREKLWAEIAEGQIRDGIVRNVRDFGAFIDLGGSDGLLPIGEMSWQRVNDPTTLVQIGQPVKVLVLKVDHEARKVLLGLRQLQPSPWDNIHERYPVGKGKVTRVMDFGAFVELEPGIEGLIHVSELARQRVWRVADIVKPEQEVEAKIITLDPQQKRIGLSLRALIPTEKPKTEEEAAEESEPEKPAKPPKPRATPLKGGIGGGGPLFSLDPPHD
jgi:small subunit ribosomal protein S1